MQRMEGPFQLFVLGTTDLCQNRTRYSKTITLLIEPMKTMKIWGDAEMLKSWSSCDTMWRTVNLKDNCVSKEWGEFICHIPEATALENNHSNRIFGNDEMTAIFISTNFLQMKVQCHRLKWILIIVMWLTFWQTHLNVIQDCHWAPKIINYKTLNVFFSILRKNPGDPLDSKWVESWHTS